MFLHNIASPSHPSPCPRDIHTGRRSRLSPHWTRPGRGWSSTHKSNTEKVFWSQILVLRKVTLVSCMFYGATSLFMQVIISFEFLDHLEILVEPVAVSIWATQLSFLLAPAERALFCRNKRKEFPLYVRKSFNPKRQTFTLWMDSLSILSDPQQIL